MTETADSGYALEVDRENFRILLRLMYMVGTAFSQSKLATRRSWGKHLLEDWRSLDLIADKVVDEVVRADSKD